MHAVPAVVLLLPATACELAMKALRARLANRVRLAEFLRRERPWASKVGWALAEGVIGGAMGLLIVTAYLKYR